MDQGGADAPQAAPGVRPSGRSGRGRAGHVQRHGLKPFWGAIQCALSVGVVCGDDMVTSADASRYASSGIAREDGAGVAEDHDVSEIDETSRRRVNKWGPLILDDSEVVDFQAVVQPEQSATSYGAKSSTPGKFITMPGPDYVHDVTTWHYTDNAALIGILSSKCLWSSSVSMLNDASEIEYGITFAELAIKKYHDKVGLHETQRQFIDGVFQDAISSLRGNLFAVFCASTEGDDLAQWRGYSGKNGCAIGLNSSRVPRLVDRSGPARLYTQELPWPGWGRVVYDMQEQFDLVMAGFAFLALITPHPNDRDSAELFSLFHHRGVSVLATIIAHLKSDGFSSENEVRVVFDLGSQRDLVKFRPGPFGVTPYLEVAYGDDADRSDKGAFVSTPKPGKLPITEIRVGPTPHPHTAVRGIELLLEACGYFDVKVTRSNIPYR